MQYITKQELAKRLNISMRSVYNLLIAEKLNIEVLFNKELVRIDKKYRNFVASYKPKDTKPKVVK